MKRMTKTASFIVIIAILMTAFLSCGRFQAKVDWKKGNELYNARKFEEAIKRYRSALSKDPSIKKIYLNIALSYMSMYVPGSTYEKDIKYADEAIAAFKEYIKNFPDDEKADMYLVAMYKGADRKDEAIAFFQEKLRKSPGDASIMQKLAFLLAQTGKFEEAMELYQRRAQLLQTNAEAYYTVGVICWEKSYKSPYMAPDMREKIVGIGMKALEKSVDLNKDYYEAYLYMNLMYREKAKLISMDPKSVPDDKVDEYNALLAKAKELQQKALEIRKKKATM